MVKKVNEKLQEETHGLYHIQCKKSYYNWFSNTYELKELQLKYDSFKADSLFKLDSSQNFFEFDIKEIAVNQLDVEALLNDKKLYINNITINHPQIKAYKKIKNASHSIQKYFQEIKIHDLIIQDAKVTFYNYFLQQEPNIKANRIDLLLHNLYYKAPANKHPKIFEIADMNFRFIKFKTPLTDNVHVIKFDTATFSLINKNLTIKKFEILAANPQKNRSYLYVTIPQINCDNFGIKENKSFYLNTINVDNAQIFYYNGTQEKNSKKLIINQINSFLKAYSPAFSIDSFCLNNAKIQFLDNTQQKAKLTHLIQQFTAEIQHIKYDSLKPNALMKNVEAVIDIRDYKYINSNKTAVYCQNLSIDTKNEFLKIRQLAVNQKNKLDVKPFDAILKKVDYKKYFSQNILDIQAINLENLWIEEILEEKKHKSTIVNLFNTLFHEVNILDVNAKNISYQAINQLNNKSVSNFRFKGNFNIKDFFITKNRNMPQIGDCKFSIVDINYKDNIDKSIIYSKSIIYEKNNLKATQFKLENIEPKSTSKIDFEIENIEAIELNPFDVVNNNRLIIKKLILNKPQIKAQLYTKDANGRQAIWEKLHTLFPEIAVQQLLIKKGKTQLKTTPKKNNVVQQFEIKVQDFLLNEAEIKNNGANHFFSKGVELQIADQHFDFSDGVHKLYVKNMYFNTLTNDLLLKDAVLSAQKQLNDKVSNTIEATFPKISFHHFSWEQWLKNSEIQLDKLEISDAKIQLINHKKVNSKEIEFKAINIPLPKAVSKINALNISLNNCFIESYRKSDQSKSLISSFNLNTDIQQIVLSKNTATNTDIFMKQAVSSIRNLYIPFKEQAGLHVAQMVFNYAQRNMILTDFQLNNPKFTLNIPQIHLINLDYNQLKNNYFNADLLQIDHPKLSLEFPVGTEKNLVFLKTIPNLAKINLYPYISDYLYDFQLNKIFLNQGTLKTPQFSQSALTFHIEDIKINETIRPNKILQASNILFELGNFETIIKKQKISFQKLNFDFLNQYIFIDSLNITPTYLKSDYLTHNTNRKDRIALKISSLSALGFDWEKLIKTDTLNINKLNIGASEIDFYKDYALARNLGIKPTFNEIMQTVPQAYFIQNITVNPSKLTYFDKTTSKNAIQFQLDSIQIQAQNYTNLAQLDPENFNKIDFTARYGAKGRISAQIQQLPYNQLILKGALEEIDLKTLNQISEGAGHITFKRGSLSYIQFDLLLKEFQASGMVGLKYDHLKVALLNKDNSKIKFKTWLINNFLANSSNKKKEKLRKNVDYQRVIDRSFIMYWLGSIMNGVQNSF